MTNSGIFHLYRTPANVSRARQAIDEIWLAFGIAVPEAHQFDLRGVGMVLVEPADNLSLRCAVDYVSGFFACEFVDIAAKDAWEAFVLAMPDGSVCTGWRRQGDFSLEAPEIWVEGAITLPVPPVPPVLAQPLCHSLISTNSEHQAFVNALSLARAAEGARERTAQLISSASPQVAPQALEPTP